MQIPTFNFKLKFSLIIYFFLSLIFTPLFSQTLIIASYQGELYHSTLVH
jgi:hypothetical protein